MRGCEGVKRGRLFGGRDDSIHLLLSSEYPILRVEGLVSISFWRLLATVAIASC